MKEGGREGETAGPRDGEKEGQGEGGTFRLVPLSLRPSISLSNGEAGSSRIGAVHEEAQWRT